MDQNEISFSIFSGLSKKYLENYDDVKKLYNYNFKNIDDFETRKKFLLSKDYDRTTLANALRDINLKYNCSPITLKNISLLEKNNTLVTITGQQTGIFLGPAYTIYKAVTTIKLAKELSNNLGCNVVPMFWIASEDHDFDEVSNIFYLSKSKIKKIKYKNGLNLNKKESIGNIKISDTFFRSIDDFINEKNIDNNFLEDLLKNNISQEDSLSDWFAKVISKLFHSYVLVIIDPMDIKIRNLQKDFFINSIENIDVIKENFKFNSNIIENDFGLQPQILFD